MHLKYHSKTRKFSFAICSMFYSFLNDILVGQWFFSHYMDGKRIYCSADLVLQIPIMYYRNDAPKRWWFGGKFCFETFSKNINFFFREMIVKSVLFFKKLILHYVKIIWQLDRFQRVELLNENWNVSWGGGGWNGASKF